MTMPVVPDPWVTPILTGLVNCLCSVLNDEDSPYQPVTCGCCIRHAAGFPSMDLCDQAWVKLDSIFPAPSRKRHCPGLSVVRVMLGIYRCVSVPTVNETDGSVTFPDCTTQMNEALIFAQDAAAMRRAVICCDELDGTDPEIIGWQPIGPQGGCAGGALTVEFTVNMWAPALD